MLQSLRRRHDGHVRLVIRACATMVLQRAWRDNRRRLRAKWGAIRVIIRACAAIVLQRAWGDNRQRLRAACRAALVRRRQRRAAARRIQNVWRRERRRRLRWLRALLEASRRLDEIGSASARATRDPGISALPSAANSRSLSGLGRRSPANEDVDAVALSERLLSRTRDGAGASSYARRRRRTRDGAGAS